MPSKARVVLAFCFLFVAGAAPAQDVLDARLDALEAEVAAAEDVSAIKRLQRTYGFYVDKGMWADLAEYFTDDAVASYPAGVYVGKDSLRKHLFLNVGGGTLSDIGLPDGRLYNHMNIQPVIHIDPDGRTAKGRWRAFAMFGTFGGGATWAEGVYEMTYEKVDGVWKIAVLDYHAGFAAPYATGWVPPAATAPAPESASSAALAPQTLAAPALSEPASAPTPATAPALTPETVPAPTVALPAPAIPTARAASRFGNLPHPADRPRRAACEGFPAACVAPFHYANPGTRAGARVWTTVRSAGLGSSEDPRERAIGVALRAERLADEQAIENLQRVYGYYFDARLWDDVAALFADDGTLEMDLRGVYVGRERIREFLDLLGPVGIEQGVLNDHVQLQIVATVAADGRSAKARSRSFSMTGVHGGDGAWSEGIYENTFVKEGGVWKIKDLRYFPTFITAYDKGWAQDAQPAPTASSELPPDRPPTSVYEIYPRAHIPPYHYDNPITGAPPRYPTGRGEPDAAAIAAVLAPVETEVGGRERRERPPLDSLVAEVEREIARVKDYHEIENLQSAYGYYLDKNLWNDLATLFAADGSIELAQRGVYVGRERVRGMLFNVFGAEGPQAGRLGNHIQWQPVIHVAADGGTGRLRARMMQQLNFGPRASMGASLYENEVVKEDGVWKFLRVHALNTWTAGYDGGWSNSPGTTVPGPSRTYPPDAPPTVTFEMFPNVYEIPFHYEHPVVGRSER